MISELGEPVDGHVWRDFRFAPVGEAVAEDACGEGYFPALPFVTGKCPTACVVHQVGALDGVAIVWHALGSAGLAEPAFALRIDIDAAFEAQ